MPRSPSAAVTPATALETIYRRHQGLVRWVLRARGVPEAALEDHVHDVFLAILRRLPERDPAVPMRAWVAGVARNVGFSHRRAAARQRQRALRLAPPEDPRRPDEELERRQAWQALSAFLDDLGPEQREVFVMVEVTGMRISELAATMGMPANTLHSRLKVARTRFSERFAAAGDGRGALLRCAREQGRAEPKERRRTWASIAASIEGLSAGSGATAGAATTLAWIGGGSRMLTAVTLAVGVIGAAAVVGARSPSVRRGEDEAVVRSEAPAPVARAAQASLPREPTAEPSPSVASAPPTASEATPERPRPREPARGRAPMRAGPAGAAREPGDEVAPGDAELVRAMAVLQRARDHLALGRAREALAALDEPRTSFGMLERERRRLELEAACRLPDPSRSRAAADALAELGATVDPAAPCEPRRD